MVDDASPDSDDVHVSVHGQVMSVEELVKVIEKSRRRRGDDS